MEGRYLLGVEPVDQAVAFLERHSTTEIDRAALDAAARRRRAERGFAPAVAARPLPEDAEKVARVTGRPLFLELFASAPVEVATVEIGRLVTAQPHVNAGYALAHVPVAPAGDPL